MQVGGLNQYMSGADSGVAARKDMGSKDVFLQLLTAQMQHQDPLNPQDPTQMSSQLAQFNMVEQQISTNDLLSGLIDALNKGLGKTADPASYLGRKVTAESSRIYFDGTKAQDIIIESLGTASDATLTIRDANGSVVRTLNLGGLQNGSNQVQWDGKNDSGAVVAAGSYSIEVSAHDTSGSTVTTRTSVRAVVTGVKMDGLGGQLLMLGKLPITLDAIREIQV